MCMFLDKNFRWKYRDKWYRWINSPHNTRWTGNTVSVSHHTSIICLSMALQPVDGLDLFRYRDFTSNVPSDGWSARPRNLYITTHNFHKRQASMPPAWNHLQQCCFVCIVYFHCSHRLLSGPHNTRSVAHDTSKNCIFFTIGTRNNCIHPTLCKKNLSDQ
jgi:hypothetical protein